MNPRAQQTFPRLRSQSELNALDRELRHKERLAHWIGQLSLGFASVTAIACLAILILKA